MISWSSIFAIAPDCHASNTGHYANLWRTHFYEGIRSAGVSLSIPERIDYSWSYHSTLTASEIREARAGASEQLRSELLPAIADNRVNAVVSYMRSHQVEPSLVTEIESLGIPWINFFCDSISQFDDVRELASRASLNWFPESAASEKYRALGRPALCRPYALNFAKLPAIDSSAVSAEKVGFIGVPSTNRITMLSLLTLFGCPLEIHGYGWNATSSSASPSSAARWEKLRHAVTEPGRLERIFRRMGWIYLRDKARGPLDDAGLHRFFSECRIVLGLNDARTSSGRLKSYMKFRDLEMPASGCCYLTQHNPDIVSALEPGKEVLTFKNLSEAREQIRQYLPRPEICRRIGLAARARILREHNWNVRLQQLQSALGEM